MTDDEIERLAERLCDSRYIRDQEQKTEATADPCLGAFYEGAFYGFMGRHSTIEEIEAVSATMDAIFRARLAGD
jgi:hypothetical protein